MVPVNFQHVRLAQQPRKLGLSTSRIRRIVSHTSTTSGSKSSPRKIFHRSSSGARTPTSNSACTTKEKTSTRNRGAEGTSISTAKATPTARDRGTGDWNQRNYDRFTLSKTQINKCLKMVLLFNTRSITFSVLVELIMGCIKNNFPS